LGLLVVTIEAQRRTRQRYAQQRRIARRVVYIVTRRTLERAVARAAEERRYEQGIVTRVARIVAIAARGCLRLVLPTNADGMVIGEVDTDIRARCYVRRAARRAPIGIKGHGSIVARQTQLGCPTRLTNGDVHGRTRIDRVHRSTRRMVPERSFGNGGLAIVRSMAGKADLGGGPAPTREVVFAANDPGRARISGGH